MERKLAGRGIVGRGREERGCGRKTSAKGQNGNVCIGSDGIKRLGAGGRVSGGWPGQGESNASGRGPFTSRQNEPGQTHPEPEFTL